MDELDELVTSSLEREITRDGITVAIRIYRGADEDEWILDVEDQDGGSTVWNEQFPTDQAALDEAMRTIDTEGIGTVTSRPEQVGPTLRPPIRGRASRGHQVDRATCGSAGGGSHCFWLPERAVRTTPLSEEGHG